jgi:cytosine/adenosine deaminase-related metal-dependent hydrolase
LFFERLGADPSIVEERVADCLRFLQGREVTDWEKAISPHAPYSVHPMMLETLVDISIKAKAPLAMHVAESLSEIEWIENQSGPFADLLQMLGAFFPNELNHYSVAKVIEQLSRAPRSLLIHGNYLKGFEIKLIAKNRGKMSVVFCPRTHQFFQHDEYPLADLLKAGIRVGLGTDSRASNPDLNLLREGQQVATLFTGMPPTKIVEMMTLDGAKALGCDEMYGSIEPGKSCRLVSIELGQEKTNPLEQILSGANFIARPILI